MALIEWQDRFRIGIAPVDHEHRELIELLNQLYARLTEDAGPEEIGAFLGEIFAQVSAHFALEERIMRERGYDQLSEHKAQHEALLDEIRDIMDAYESGDLDRSVEAFGQQMEAWFGDHFRTHDARLHKTIGDPGGPGGGP